MAAGLRGEQSLNHLGISIFGKIFFEYGSTWTKVPYLSMYSSSCWLESSEIEAEFGLTAEAALPQT